MARAAASMDMSLSQAQDVNWDEVGYAPEMDAAAAAAERRRIQREMRQLLQQTTADQAPFYEARAAEVVHAVLDESADLLRQTRQTAEAAIDAALVIRVSELAYKRTAHFLADRTDDAGVALDDFVARCTDYMRSGRGLADAGDPRLSRAQRRRRRLEGGRGARAEGGGAEPGPEPDEPDEDVSDDADAEAGADADADARPPLDWSHFGQYACLPRTRRPGLARFLPRAGLSAEEKTRVLRKRTAALRLHELPEVRPEVLRADEVARGGGGGGGAGSDLTALATDILRQLRQAVEQGQAQVQRAYDALEEDDEEGAALRRLMERHGLRSDGGVDLVRFAVNPRSFGQTVENFFYISFLVRDGRVGLAYDDSGLPSIYPIDDSEAKEAGLGEDAQKHQLILSIDMATWRDLVATFGIQQSMIAHREAAAAAHPGGRAWFT